MCSSLWSHLLTSVLSTYILGMLQNFRIALPTLLNWLPDMRTQRAQETSGVALHTSSPAFGKVHFHLQTWSSLRSFSSRMFSLMSKHTSELGVGNTSPFSTTIPNARAPHHVAHIVLFVPLISNAIHDPFIGCADFLVGCMEMDGEMTTVSKNIRGIISPAWLA